MRVCALESLQTPCHQPPQKLQIYCRALQRHLILLTVYLMCVFHLLVLCPYSVSLFVLVRLVVLMTVYLMINSFCLANRPAVVHWLWTMMKIENLVSGFLRQLLLNFL